MREVSNTLDSVIFIIIETHNKSVRFGMINNPAILGSISKVTQSGLRLSSLDRGPGLFNFHTFSYFNYINHLDFTSKLELINIFSQF